MCWPPAARCCWSRSHRGCGHEALDPLAVAEADWLREPYSLGAEFPMPTGVLTTYGPALRAPVGRIHWGSAETATRWVGYMCGAVEAGERTVREVLAALQGVSACT
jgi:monoamine oxidase